MTAQELLDELLKLKDKGVDLSALEVIAIYTVYDYSIPYDVGEDCEKYIGSVEANTTALILS